MRWPCICSTNASRVGQRCAKDVGSNCSYTDLLPQAISALDPPAASSWPPTFLHQQPRVAWQARRWAEDRERKPEVPGRHWEAWLREAEGAAGRESIFGPVAVTWCSMSCLSHESDLFPPRPDPLRRLIGSHALLRAWRPNPDFPAAPAPSPWRRRQTTTPAEARSFRLRRGRSPVRDRKGNKSGARAAGPPQPPDPISPRKNKRSAPRYTFTCFAKIRVYLLKRQEVVPFTSGLAFTSQVRFSRTRSGPLPSKCYVGINHSVPTAVNTCLFLGLSQWDGSFSLGMVSTKWVSLCFLRVPILLSFPLPRPPFGPQLVFWTLLCSPNVYWYDILAVSETPGIQR